jgi:predicted lactoylglutathione lyase
MARQIYVNLPVKDLKRSMSMAFVIHFWFC